MLRLVPLLLIVAVISGCAASDTMVMEPLPLNPGSYSSFEFWVVPHVTEDMANEQADLIQKVLSRARKLNVFEKVGAGAPRDSAPGTLFAEATVTHIRKVSGTERFFRGVFAGYASMTCDVVFIDGETGKVIGSYHIRGDSGSTALSGGTGDAISETAQTIVRILKESYFPPKPKSHDPAW